MIVSQIIGGFIGGALIICTSKPSEFSHPFLILGAAMILGALLTGQLFLAAKLGDK